MVAKMTVELEYDEEALGRFWFNEDNLKQCLFGETHTKPELLKVVVVEHSDRTALLCAQKGGP